MISEFGALDEVPEQHKQVFSWAMGEVARRIQDASEDSPELDCALMWLLFLPQALCRKPRRGGRSGRGLVTQRFKNSKIRLNRGDRVALRADGTLAMTPWGSNMMSTPDGNTNCSYFKVGSNKFYGGTLLAKIGSSGKIFKAGSKLTFTAEQAGVLSFAIAMNTSYGSGNHQFPGQYNVKIRVDRAAEK